LEENRKSIENTEKPYLRFDYPRRKKSNIPFYTLIPIKTLQEIQETHPKLPFQTQRE
jgi:hypothetical protein